MKVLSYLDYQKAGEEKDLIFRESFTPSRYDQNCRWTCKHCGDMLTKSYRTVSSMSIGCKCQSSRNLDLTKYHSLARSLGIKFLPEEGRFPKNTKDLVKWLSRDGETVVQASFNELYRTNRIPKRLRTPLGL